MKKLFFLLGIFLIGANLTLAQNSLSEPAPNVSINNVKWFKHTRFSRFGGSDPLPNETDKNAPIIEPIRAPTNGAKELFIYQADFKNETERKIKGFVWDYIFLNSDGSRELQRHEFLYPYKFGKNKKITARNEITLPPTNIINADDLKKNAASPYVERVEIKCVIFEDDSIWKRADAAENACQTLGSLIREREQRRKGN